MLVLGRKENERLIIDGNIVVIVVRASNGTVRLGIEAPAHISIQREEICNPPANPKPRRSLAGCAG